MHVKIGEPGFSILSLSLRDNHPSDASISADSKTHIVRIEEAVKLWDAGRVAVWMPWLPVSIHSHFDRVGMRFETSQSTPTFLDRRIQLRMMSFVGLIAFIMVGLAVMNSPAKKQRMAQRPNRDAPADNLSFDVERDEVALKPGEVIILASGQAAESRGQSDDQLVVLGDAQDDDHGLFKPRRLEHVKDENFFSRRTKPTTNNVDVQPKDAFLEDDNNDDVEEGLQTETVPSRARVRDELPPLDEDPPRRIDRRPANERRSLDTETAGQREWDEPPSSPPLKVSGKGGISDLLFRKKSALPDTIESADDLTKLPQFEEPRRSNDAFDTQNDDLADDLRGTVPNPSTTRDFDDRDDAPVTTAPFRAPKKSKPLRSIDPLDDLSQDDPQAATTDNGPDRDLWIKGDSDAEPFREDYASVRIDKRYLDIVKDNTLGVRRDESDVFYWLLDHARRVPSTKLEKAGLREVQYINLMTEPDRFRGEPITIEGDLWRLYEFPATRNDYSVSRVYEGWVFTGDSANHPYRVVFTSLPKGIEPGENLRIPVRITGYFFKREGYRSNGGVHVAPTLLARRIAINTMPNGIPMMAGVVPYVIGAIMAVGLAILVTIVGFAVGDERSMRTGMQRMRHYPHVAFDNLVAAPSISVEESLRQLAERERLTAVSGAYGPLFSRQTAREHAMHDYATSRRIEVDVEHNREQRQTNTVQNWTARQRATQAEIDALKAQNSKQFRSGAGINDGLDSDSFDPARHRVHTPIPHVQPVLAPEVNRYPTSVGVTTSVANPHPVVSQLHSVVTPIPAGNGVSYGASKLSDWEEEIQRMANRSKSQPTIGPVATNVAALSAAEQIERDRLGREREIRERLAREQAEREHHRHEESQRHAHDQATQHQFDGNTYSLPLAESGNAPVDHVERTGLQHEHDHQNRPLTDYSKYPSQAAHSHSHSHSHTHSTLTNEEYERLEREQRERLHHEHLRQERERIEHEQNERERQDRERLEREHRHTHSPGLSHSHEHSHEHNPVQPHREYHRHEEAADVLDSDVDEEYGDTGLPETTSETNTEQTSAKTRGGWGWPRRRKTADAAGDSATSDEPIDDSTAGDDSSGASSSGWGRSRKRRRQRHDDGTA